MKLRHISAALLALFNASAVLAADEPLTPARIVGSGPNSGDVLLGALKLGKRQGDVFSVTAPVAGPVDAGTVGGALLPSILAGKAGLSGASFTGPVSAAALLGNIGASTFIPSQSAPLGSVAAWTAINRVSAAFIGAYPNNANLAQANGDAFNQAAASLGATGGGTIEIPCGDYFTTNIDNKYPGVLFKGPPSMAGPRAGGAPTYCVHMIAVQSGTLYKQRTPYGLGLSKYSGGGFENIWWDGNNVSTRVAEIDTITHAILKGVVSGAVGREAVWFKSGVARELNGDGTVKYEGDVYDNANNQYHEIKLSCQQLFGGGANTDCFRLDGSANADFSLNWNVEFTCTHYNGNCVTGYLADSNTINLSAFRYPGGTGYGFYGYGYSRGGGGEFVTDGFYGNYFTHLGTNAPVYQQGVGETFIDPSNSSIIRTTSAPPNATGNYNEVQNVNVANGAPTPTSGPGATWYGEFKQTFNPVVTCASGGQSLGGFFATGKFIHRKAGDVTFFPEFTITDKGSCVGDLLMTLPRPASSGAMAGTAIATNRAQGGSYGVRTLPATSQLAIQSLQPGVAANLPTGAAVSASITYPAAY